MNWGGAFLQKGPAPPPPRHPAPPPPELYTPPDPLALHDAVPI